MTTTHITLTSSSPEDTQRIGANLGGALYPGACVALIGNLGAGKTELTKGIARGLAVPEDISVNSPTFILINEYPGRLHIYHLDAYRLSGTAELDALGFEEMVRGDQCAVVEWADRTPDALPEDRIIVRITHKEDQTRDIDIEATGEQSRKAIDKM